MILVLNTHVLTKKLLKKKKTKHLLVENELKKLKTFDSSILEVKVALKKMVHKII